MDLDILGRIRSGSNMVFLAEDSSGDRWVHKPVRGESPLRDFPAGVLPPAAAEAGASPAAQIAGTLAAREVATYRVARAAGWDVVPETRAVVTSAGPGMAQRWLDVAAGGDHPPLVDVVGPDAVPDGHLPVLALEDEDGRPLVLAHADGPRLRRMALLDVVTNNTDRKAGHVLRTTDGLAWGIDHGLTFHVVPKVRSVLWGFVGVPLDDDEERSLTALRAALEQGPLARELGVLLAADEVAAVGSRVDAVLAAGRFPGPTLDFPLPWPLF